jgi:membrane carboxypeptidase/penicillin-binding protein PbpC
VPSGAAIEECTWHHASEHGVLTVWPEPYRHWARMAGVLTDAAPAPPAASIKAAPVAPRQAPAGTSDRARPNRAALTIVAPLAGAVYLFDPTLRPEFQTLPLRAQGATGRLEWFVNDRSIGTAGGDETMRWPLVRGMYAITVKDAGGQSAETKIVVR